MKRMKSNSRQKGQILKSFDINENFASVISKDSGSGSQKIFSLTVSKAEIFGAMGIYLLNSHLT